MFRSLRQPMWDLTIHPLPGPAFSLRHRLVSGSDTICNHPSPSLADIVRFDSLRIAISLTIFKTRMLGRGFHILIRNVSFPSPIDVGSHNPPPWGPMSLLRHRSVTGSDTIGYSPDPPLVDIVRFAPLRITINLTVLKTHLLGRGFHILIRNVSFPSPIDVGSHNPPLWGPASSLAHRLAPGFDTICNSPSSPLADIVRFGPLHIVVSLTVLKCIC